MRRKSIASVSLLALIVSLSGPRAFPAIAAGEAAVGPAPDYASVANWVCRPGSENVCTKDLDAKVVAADGSSHSERFQAAADPPIDCFYVYPTVSQEKRPYADLSITPEIATVVNAQVGRLTSRCRVYAPVYRQATIAHLLAELRGEDQAESNVPDKDVSAALRYYFAHDNRGRGVVLIGHSQGTIILQKVLAADFDGKPAQASLVSAFLAGDPSFGIPKDALVGGTFAHIPVCASAEETGCAYVWGSFDTTSEPEDHVFGSSRDDTLKSACENPAAPTGGTASLKMFERKDADAPAADPPWVEVIGQLTGSCVESSAGNAFGVTVLPGRFAKANEAYLQGLALRGGWGLHRLDIGLVQGNILDVIDAETKAWLARHPR